MSWRFQNKLKSHRKKCKTRERTMHVSIGWSYWVCGLTSSPSTAAEWFISPQRSQYSLCGRLSLSRRDSPECVYLHSPPMFGHVPALLPYLQPPVVISRRKEWAENEERVDYLACKLLRRRQRRSACLRFRRLPRLCCACPPRWFWPRVTGSRGFGGHFLLETDFKKR